MTHAERIRKIKEKQESHREYAEGYGLANGIQEWWENLEFLLSRLEAAEAVVEAAKRITHRDEGLHRAIVEYEGGGDVSG